MTTPVSGHFTYADWQERPASSDEPPTGPRLAHATVTDAFTGGITAPRTTCAYTIAYSTDSEGTFTGLHRLDGEVDGRKGAFVVEERGRFTGDGSIHGSFEVVPGTGTGELTGLRGTGGYTAGRGQPSVPYTFAYDLEGRL
ncbi:DUF3224 domain-containing protein [Streptomyces sp. ODS28]|uniref:DUF3224 domain-containing protein n=1 Tax=Streptomyces sp. ODS28 TaxID=3136688 RepID=UPI0031EC651B